MGEIDVCKPVLLRSRVPVLVCNYHSKRVAEAARPDRAACAVQRLLAAAATLSATLSASRPADLPHLLSFPTRRSSDLFRAGSLYPLARGCRRIWRGEKWLTRSASQ